MFKRSVWDWMCVVVGRFNGLFAAACRWEAVDRLANWSRRIVTVTVGLPYLFCEEKTPHGVETRQHSLEAFSNPCLRRGFFLSFCSLFRLWLKRCAPFKARILRAAATCRLRRIDERSGVGHLRCRSSGGHRPWCRQWSVVLCRAATPHRVPASRRSNLLVSPSGIELGFEEVLVASTPWLQ